VKVDGVWATVDLDLVQDPAGPSGFEAYGPQCAAAGAVDR